MWIKPVWEFFLFDKVGKKSAALLKLTQTARKFFLLANSGREKLFVKKKCIIYNFFHVMQYFLPYAMAVMVGENSPPSRFLKQKHRSAKSDVSKVLFPDTGKITNPTTQMFPPVFVL